jgi:hypothetical protein
MRFVALALLIVIAGCTAPDKATQLLKAQGYTDIKITGYNFLGCSEDDITHTGFTAKTPAGITINGTVCGGMLFKGATIRFE